MTTVATWSDAGRPLKALLWCARGRLVDERPADTPARRSFREAGSTASLAELAVAAAQGDEDAFGALHRRVGAGLRRVFMQRTGGRDDVVDDLMQTTWGAVWRALRSGRYDPARAAITTFVYAVGNNAWLTHLRRSGRAARREDQRAHEAEPTEPSAEAAMAEAELIDAVRACVREEGSAGLSEQERTIVLGMASGRSDRALAKALGLSCSTVNVKKQKALDKIRQHLGAKGFEGAGDQTPGIAGRVGGRGVGPSTGLAGGVA